MTEFNMELRPLWRRFFRFDWRFGLFLVMAVCVPRFVLVLNANSSGNYSSIGLIMTVSAIVPFIFLSKQGRKEAGITRPQKFVRLLPAFVAGIGVSLLFYAIGRVLFGTGIENPYVYIGKSYHIPEGMSSSDKLMMFLIMIVSGMTFSPVGEELFFRGIVHAAFAKTTGGQKASVIDGSAFALTHLSHFGLVFTAGVWHFLPVPALIWVLGMFAVSLLFIRFKKYSGSILGAIVCHAGFNLGMIYSIFFWL